MGEILQNWIQARLGIMIDLSPEVFGHYTRDGSLLGQILYSYDIINRDQLDTIIDTQDPALCRVNLKHLRVWLRFLGVDCDDESIEEISCGKGTTSLRLFYKVYLCLETKDRLHFITLQKEREKFVPSSKKFEVTTISEDPPPYQPPEHPLSRRLVEGKETVNWHRSNLPMLLRTLKRQRDELEDWKAYPVMEPVEYCVAEKPKPVDTTRKQQSEELDRFARKHRVHPRSLPEYEEQTVEKESPKIVEDPEMAKAYVEWLKCRSKRATTINALKSKMQKALLSELWERMAEKQERAFDEAIASRVLDQSRYEKRIVAKLCEVRDQKNVMAENQKILEDMTLEANEMEYRASVEREKDMACKKRRDIEVECQRMCELRQRLRQEKIRKLREKHRKVCRETAEDIVNFALRIVAYRRANDGHVPKGMLREWKTLFLGCQPIFDDEISCEIEGGTDEEDKEQIFEEVARIKLEQVEALQDALFEDYHEGNSPWDEFLPLLAEDAKETFELGRVVLGYVVHRLLNYLRTDPTDRARALLPKFHSAAIILGIADPTVHETIRGLIEKSKVRLVRMEDAINYCLERYKNEMSDVEYIDLNVVAATDRIVQELQRGRRRISCLKSRWSNERSQVDEVASRPSKSSTSTKGRGEKKKVKSKSTDSEKKAEEQPVPLEKQTQTPRNIPYDDMDPRLTDAAYIGKWVYEFLALGEPISNDLATKILLEYLKSLTKAVGWALIEYPNTYEQLSLLETALTGSNLPPNPDTLDFEDVTIEDVESVTPRIVYEEEVDPSTLYRQSRLVPNPMKRPEDIPTATFATLFVRVAHKPKNLELEERSYETLKPDTPSVDKFYASRMIAYLFYYDTLDLTTLKRLARLVLGERSRRKPSEELFGDVLTTYERDKGRSTVSKSPVVRRLLAEPVDEDLLEDDMAEREEEPDFTDYDSQTIELELREARPGDTGWQWIDFPLPSVLVKYLANLWEDLEETYAEGLKELLFLKSMHSSGIIPYKDFVTRNAAEFVNRPHNKQDSLHNFHKTFNDIDDDARNDVDVKCELHRRVADLQAQLWQVCDERRHESEEERKRFVNDQWTVYEAMVLFNVYIGIVQTEIDRCIDTLHLLQDYYLGMLKKPLQEPRFSKVLLQKMELDSAEPVNSESSKTVEQLIDRKDTKEGSRVKSGSSKTLPASSPSPPPAAEYVVLQKEIANLLTDRNKTFLDPDEISMFKTILENVRYARGIVDGLYTITNDVLKREDVAASKGKDFVTDSSDPSAAKLVMEWRYGVAYEIERIRLRLESITAAARSDIGFLLETMQKTFHRIHDSIVDRYWREMKSVNDMANVFCFAIEEARPLEREMLLDGDRFVVRSNVFLMKVDPKSTMTTKEAASASRFRIAQLSRLMEVLKRVAPYGAMAEVSLVYILQDLASHGMEEGESLSLPCCWYQLRSRDISSLVGQLFESADYVDWREFIFYAMDLPMPSPREILIARDRFRIQDPNLKEVVSCAQFHRTPLWFLDSTETIIDVYEFLRDDFQRNIEELYEEELYHLNCDGREDRGNGSTIFNLKAFWKNPEETLRLILAKELLCRMYMTGRHTVNYTALLLAFCKDEDPREGFAKALALALGNRVCTDLDEGERYVEELYEQRRLAREMRLSRKNSYDESLQVTKGIIHWLMAKVDQTIERAMYPEKQDLNERTGTDPFETQSSNSEEMECEGISLTSSFVEASRGFKERATDQELVIYWLPLEACLTVLAAALPWHVLKPELFGPCMNLRDSLAVVYEELRVDDFSNEENVVLAHRLLNHDFIKRLLSNVSKFTLKNMGNMIRDILRAREEEGKL